MLLEACVCVAMPVEASAFGMRNLVAYMDNALRTYACLVPSRVVLCDGVC